MAANGHQIGHFGKTWFTLVELQQRFFVLFAHYKSSVEYWTHIWSKIFFKPWVLPCKTLLKCGVLKKSFIMNAPLWVEHSSHHFLVGLLLCTHQKVMRCSTQLNQITFRNALLEIRMKHPPFHRFFFKSWNRAVWNEEQWINIANEPAIYLLGSTWVTF